MDNAEVGGTRSNTPRKEDKERVSFTEGWDPDKRVEIRYVS